ncbi:hypothetical protein NpPPO83_00007861 [Neofusicoccum parvum]|uniref:Uncharacterized protein n=1 Tax=Neofusicoccum parvum TaxID=310453 RepID=A0ACB5SQF3_9PEZI|nr:hypothetical protein NpPPO83_00007861 [Neofusicoccum parvum]
MEQEDATPQPRAGTPASPPRIPDKPCPKTPPALDKPCPKSPPAPDKPRPRTPPSGPPSEHAAASPLSPTTGDAASVPKRTPSPPAAARLPAPPAPRKRRRRDAEEEEEEEEEEHYTPEFDGDALARRIQDWLDVVPVPGWRR